MPFSCWFARVGGSPLSNLNIFYYLEMDKVEEDIKQLEQDIQEIRCNPLIKFMTDLFKCIQDCVIYFTGQKNN